MVCQTSGVFLLALYLSLAQSAFRVPFRQSKTADSWKGGRCQRDGYKLPGSPIAYLMDGQNKETELRRARRRNNTWSWVDMFLIRPLLACSHSLRLSWQGRMQTELDPRFHPGSRASRRRHSPSATNSRVSRRTTRMCKRARTTYLRVTSVWPVWRTAST